MAVVSWGEGAGCPAELTAPAGRDYPDDLRSQMSGCEFLYLWKKYIKKKEKKKKVSICFTNGFTIVFKDRCALRARDRAEEDFI